MAKINSGFKEIVGSELRAKEKILPNETVKSAAMTEEGQFLSLLLHDKSLVEDVVSNSMIDIEYFYVGRNGLLFGLILMAFQKYGALLTDAALEEYTRNSPTSTDERVFFDKINRIRSKKEDYQRLKKNITDRYLQQRFYELCWVGEDEKDGLVNQILNASTNQVDLISSLQDKLIDLNSQFNRDSASRVSSISDVLDKVIADITRRRDNPGSNWGCLTGFDGIDETIFGLRPGEYGIVVGYPNGGKTTFMINLALGMAKSHVFRGVERKGAKVCYVTVEVDDEELTERMLCNWAHISSSLLKEGGEKITCEFYEKILRAKQSMQQEIGNSFTVINVTQNTPVTELLSLIDAKRRVLGFDVVFVDYLDVISSVRKFDGRPDLEIGEVSVMLQAYAKKHKLVMITAQSFNNEMIKAIKKQQMMAKEDQSVKDKVASVIGLEGIGGTQKLSRDADFVWGLMLGNEGSLMTVFWLKSRKSKKPEAFLLGAQLEHCRLINAKDTGKEFDAEALISAQKNPELVKKKIEEREKASLNNAVTVEKLTQDPRGESVPGVMPTVDERFFDSAISSVTKENASGQSDDKETDIQSG